MENANYCTRKHGRLYLDWNEGEIIYTVMELRKLYLNFFYPTPDKLFNLIARKNLKVITKKQKKS